MWDPPPGLQVLRLLQAAVDLRLSPLWALWFSQWQVCPASPSSERLVCIRPSGLQHFLQLLLLWLAQCGLSSTPSRCPLTVPALWPVLRPSCWHRVMRCPEDHSLACARSAWECEHFLPCRTNLWAEGDQSLKMRSLLSVPWAQSEWHRLVALGGCCVGPPPFLPHSPGHSLPFPFNPGSAFQKLRQKQASLSWVCSSPVCLQECGKGNACLKCPWVALSWVIHAAILPCALCTSRTRGT